MNNNLTEIVVILDKSGSMAHLTGETIASFNNFVKEQKAVPGEANLTVVLFDTTYSNILDGKRLSDVPDNFLNSDNYRPDGYTALYDAIGSTVDSLGRRLAGMPEADRPGKVMVVVITDGEENSSKEFRQRDIRDKVTHQQDKYKWNFLYLGTTLEQMAQGASIGTKSHNMLRYDNSASGVQMAYCSISSYARSLRENGKGVALDAANTTVC